MGTKLLDFLSTTTGGAMLIAATLGLALAAVTAPRWSTSARTAHREAAVSPLWLLMPIVMGFALVWWADDAGILLSAFGMKVPGLLVFQVLVALWILWRFRRWPFFVLPLAALCCLWQWGLMMGAVLDGVTALASS